MDNKITFTSIIRPVKRSMFNNVVSGISRKNFVEYPWTVKESVIAKDAYTTGVIDCTVCGITDGEKVFMMHICPTNKDNFNFKKIKDFITKKVDLSNEDLSAVVIGAKSYPDDSRSYKLFDNFVKFLKSKNIPTTSIKGGDVYESVDVLYRQRNDEWLISGKYLDKYIDHTSSGLVLNKIFPQIELSEFDIII